MRAVIDTNVLISGVISNKSFPAKVLDYWVIRRFIPVISGEIVKEYSAVLLRDKFSALGSIKERLDLLDRLLSLDHVIVISPQLKTEVITEDPKDNIFLECAVAGGCEFIISGDQHLLQVKDYNSIKIVTAREFINKMDSA
jgi:hypothetical protein